MGTHESYIDFTHIGKSKSGKTDIYVVTSDRDDLGEIKWWAHWRRYVFMPDAETVFEQDCLREIATFIEELTQEHKNDH